MAEQMKPSGIGWIGDIPESWKCSKVKFCFSLVNGSTPESSDYDCWDGDIKWVTPADMSDTGTISHGERFITKYGYNSCGTTLLPVGSIVISSRAPIGKINITTAELCTNQGCKSLIRYADNKYFYYLFLAGQNELSLLGRGTTFLELSTYDLNGFGLVIPAEDEQKVIADFLDKECAQIDSIVADLEKQIALLQQYKKSLITETLTKGLDKSAPMKDSEVEWIGKIPEHWELKHLKYLAKSILDGAHLTPTYTDDGIPFLRVTDITSVDGIDAEINLDTVARISKEEHRILCQRCHPQKGDVLVSKNGTIGVPKIIDWDWEFSIFVSLCLIKLNDSLLNKWLFYYFKSTLVATEIAFAGKTNTITNLHLEKIANFKIPLPSVEEQKLIATYLDEKVCKIDALIKEKQSQLETLRQHKKSLIYEYVTGKKRVKEVR